MRPLTAAVAGGVAAASFVAYRRWHLRWGARDDLLDSLGGTVLRRS
jgi:hypothetical protein